MNRHFPSRYWQRPGRSHCIRLYVFSSEGYDITRAAGADPSFLVVQGTTSIKPDRVYRDHGLNATSGLVTTSCFILPNSTKPGQTIKLIMDNSPGTSCILEGAALVVVSRNENGPNIWYWLHEGADVISAPPGRENNDAETTAEFDLEPVRIRIFSRRPPIYQYQYGV